MKTIANAPAVLRHMENNLGIYIGMVTLLLADVNRSWGAVVTAGKSRIFVSFSSEINRVQVHVQSGQRHTRTKPSTRSERVALPLTSGHFAPETPGVRYAGGITASRDVGRSDYSVLSLHALP